MIPFLTGKASSIQRFKGEPPKIILLNGRLHFIADPGYYIPGTSLEIHQSAGTF